jgi:hypothetical protein
VRWGLPALINKAQRMYDARQFTIRRGRVRLSTQPSSALPSRVLSGRWWHQNAPRFALLDCADPAVVDAESRKQT